MKTGIYWKSSGGRSVAGMFTCSYSFSLVRSKPTGSTICSKHSNVVQILYRYTEYNKVWAVTTVTPPQRYRNAGLKKNYNYAEIDVKCSQHTLEQLYECLRQLLPTSVHAVKLAKKLHSQLPDKYRTVLMLFSGAEKESNAVAKMCCIKWHFTLHHHIT